MVRNLVTSVRLNYGMAEEVKVAGIQKMGSQDCKLFPGYADHNSRGPGGLK